MGVFSNRIERDRLKPGDHIYTWRTLYIYAHHGIYVGNDRVIHFTRHGQEVGTGTKLDHLLSSSVPVQYQYCPTCTPPEGGHGVISSCLNCFLAGDALYRFEYGVSAAFFLAKARGGTCTLAVSDPCDEVVHRASRLLEIGFGCYNVLKHNCEHFAIFCKTGLLILAQGEMGQSGQAEYIEGTLLAIIALALRLGTTNVIGMATKANVFLMATTAAKTIWDYCSKRYDDDIGVRKDVAKVSMDDLKRMLETSKLQGTMPPATNATTAPENNDEVLMARLAKIVEHHINTNQGVADNNGEVWKVITSLAKIVAENANKVAIEIDGKVLKLIESLAKFGENQENTIQGATGEVNSALERFTNLEPPIFKGTSGPLEAQSWIAEIENIFEVMRCPDMQKVTFAVSMLIEQADDWWKCTEKLLPESVTWESFTKAFNEKYFSDAVRDREEREFTDLFQGSMTAREYDAEFTELSQFAPYSIPSQKAKQSRNGKGACYRCGRLGHHIKDCPPPQFEQPKTSSNEKQKHKGACYRCGQLGHHIRDCPSPQFGQPKTSSNEKQKHKGACYKCGQSGHHIRDCPSRQFEQPKTSSYEKHKRKGACYKCGQLDHHIKDCPSRQFEQPKTSSDAKPW